MRSAHVNSRCSYMTVKDYVHILVVISAIVGVALDRRQFHSGFILGPIALFYQLLRALLDMLVPLRRLHHLIHQAPVFCALSLNPLRNRAEDVSQIAAHFALVGYASQPSSSRKNAQERHLRQTHGGRAVVDENDFVACKGKFISSSSRSPVACGQKLDSGVTAGILNPISGFVRELAEVHLPGMG